MPYLTFDQYGYCTWKKKPKWDDGKEIWIPDSGGCVTDGELKVLYLPKMKKGECRDMDQAPIVESHVIEEGD